MEKSVNKIAPVTVNSFESNIPILATSVVVNIWDLVVCKLNSNEYKLNYMLFEQSLDVLKECGFNGYVAAIHLDDNYENDNSDVYRKLLRGVFERSRDRGLSILLTSTAYYAPSSALLNKWSKTFEDTESVDSLCNQYKTKYGERIRWFNKVLKDFKDSFLGISLQDEPTFTQLTTRYNPNSTNPEEFNSPKGSYYCLSNRYNLVKEILEKELNFVGKVIRVNLVGEYNKDFMDVKNDVEDQKKTYRQYVNAFTTIIVDSAPNPAAGTYPYLWSFDFYPVLENNYLLERNYCAEQENTKYVPNPENNGRITVKYEQLFTDLELFNSKTCIGGPLNRLSAYWIYVQSMSYMAGLSWHPLAKEEYLRYVVFTSLAMGCQGITYWTYHQRPNEQKELYLSAPMDRDGNRTAVWYFARNVNEEIRKYNDIFRKSILRGWGHVGNIYSGCKVLSLPCGRLSGITVGGKGMLVTRLEGMEKTHIVIVNHDICNYQDVALSFSSGNMIYEETRINPDTGGASVIAINSTGLKRDLPPGGYLIFSYDK